MEALTTCSSKRPLRVHGAIIMPDKSERILGSHSFDENVFIDETQLGDPPPPTQFL
jgi:hypothetical protein